MPIIQSLRFDFSQPLIYGICPQCSVLGTYLHVIYLDGQIGTCASAYMYGVFSVYNFVHILLIIYNFGHICTIAQASKILHQPTYQAMTRYSVFIFASSLSYPLSQTDKSVFTEYKIWQQQLWSFKQRVSKLVFCQKLNTEVIFRFSNVMTGF